MSSGGFLNRQRLSIASSVGTAGDAFEVFRAAPWAGVADVRLADAVAKHSDAKPRSLPWLLKLMDAVYHSKGARVRGLLYGLSSYKC